jgi:predicted transcriptional regulator
MINEDLNLLYIETFLKNTGLSARVLGMKALNNPTIIYRILKGEDYKASSMEKIIAYIRSYTPQQ